MLYVTFRATLTKADGTKETGGYSFEINAPATVDSSDAIQQTIPKMLKILGFDSLQGLTISRVNPTGENYPKYIGEGFVESVGINNRHSSEVVNKYIMPNNPDLY